MKRALGAPHCRCQRHPAASHEMCGGVLSGSEIQRRVEKNAELISGETFEPKALRAASYDIRAAADEMITPQDERVPRVPSGQERRHRDLVLSSGDTASLTTVERFQMPPDLAGNITVKNRFASKGLMLLSGLLIDPGYGSSSAGARLHLQVANIGREQIVIRLGVDQIARVQFLRVYGGTEHSATPLGDQPSSDQTRLSLSFLTDLKHLRDSFERTNDLVRTVLLGGILVLAITVLGVSLSTILSLSSNEKLVYAAHAAVPQSASGKWLMGVLIFSLTVTVLVLGLMLLSRQKNPAD